MAYLLGPFLAFFLSFILLSKRNKTTADRILFAWLLISGIHMGLFYFQVTEIHFQYPFLLGLILPLPLLQWPMLYLYISSLTTNNSFRPRQLLHFIPFLVSMVIILPFLLAPANEKIYVFRHDGKGYEGTNAALLIGTIISALIYTFLSIKKIGAFRSAIRNKYSQIEKINLKWLYYLTAGMTIIFVIVLFDDNSRLTYLAVAGFIAFIGYFGIKQVGIFTQKLSPDHDQLPTSELLQSGRNVQQTRPAMVEIQSDQIPANNSNEKYLRSSLTPEDAKAIQQELSHLMRTEKPFKNEELTLDELSKMLNVLPNQLSQVINSLERKNFYDYINELRVQEFIELASLPQNRNLTLLSLSMDAGFNSKTSFNRNFKKITGRSPSEYLKELQKKP